MAHAPRSRRAWWFAALSAVVAGIAGAAFLLREHEELEPLRRLLWTRVLSPVPSAAEGSTPPSVEEATLERQLQGLAALAAEAEAGAIFPAAPDRVLVLVDQGLIQRLLTALTPSEHVIADRYRVVVTGARVVFEDGFALVRLDGRASLAGIAESEVFADLTVVGDLELPAQQEKPDVLKARIHVLTVEARQVALVGHNERAERLVGELGRTKLEAFAAIASSLEIPVRQEHTITIPAVGPEGPVRIDAASLSLRLTLVSVHAFHGKLWITMGASIASVAPPGTPPAAPGAAGAAAPHPDLRGLSRDERLLRLHEEHRHRHERFEALLAREALVGETERIQGDMILAVRAGLVKEVAQETVRRYFDRVALDVPGIEVRESGEIHADTFLGRVTAGHWTVNVNHLHVRGLLRARAPRVELKAGNEVELDLPVLLEEGEGTAGVSFAWRSHGLAKIVCRDFETEREVAGRVTPEEYPVRTRFLLTEGRDSLTATPHFEFTFRLKVEPSRESWSKVLAAIQAQDQITRCGLALDPDKIFAKLQELVGEGFVIHLPHKLLRPVTLATGLTESVDVEGRRVAVAVTHNALRITPAGLWYSIGVGVDIPGATPPGASRAPRP